MTPKERAKDIYLEYLGIFQESNMFKVGDNLNEITKKCATARVDAIYHIFVLTEPQDNPYAHLFQEEYWMEVIEELKKL